MLKHERITLVVLAYVIGFSTAYIAFALQSPNNDYYNITTSTIAHTPAIKPMEEVYAARTTSLDTISTTEKEDGFYALIEGKERILSAALINSMQPRSGFHHKIIEPSVSLSGMYIHYCVQPSAASSTCVHHIYDVTTDIVHIMTVADEPVETLIADRIIPLWLQDDTLRLSDYISVAPNTPWKVRELVTELTETSQYQEVLETQ